MTRRVRMMTVLTLLATLGVPLGLTKPPAASAAGTITIETKERGSEGPALYACYAVADLTDSGTFNGGVGGACDGADGTADGRTVVNLLGPCDPCRVSQSLPDKPNDQPTDYLLEPPQTGAEGQTFTFRNFLKPYLVVTARNAKTGRVVKGACIAVGKPGQGTSYAGCDGNLAGGAGDQDGRKNGRIVTRRLATVGTYVVVNKPPFPRGYRAARAVSVVADPAVTGQSEPVVIKLRPIKR